MMWIFTFIIPILFVWGLIVFSFDSKLTLIQKIIYFLILPISEVAVSITALIQARSIAINLIEAWQLYLLYFLFSFSMANTLMITLLSELDKKVKLAIRLITLIILGLIISWSFFFYIRN